MNHVTHHLCQDGLFSKFSSFLFKVYVLSRKGTVDKEGNSGHEFKFDFNSYFFFLSNGLVCSFVKCIWAGDGSAGEIVTTLARRGSKFGSRTHVLSGGSQPADPSSKTSAGKLKCTYHTLPPTHT